MKKAIWISYDLGLKGDYSGLYTWLDTVEAKECGDSLAFFSKEFNGDDIKENVRTEIKKNVNLNKTDRIYIIYLDSETNKMKGSYLFGGRKRAPWEGYSNGVQAIEEDSI